ncbi:glycosyltransferase [Chryseobacterium sp.]|uniref:glycosyltransferase n=1 Tax=Chryseobacterium sp. TaxID=1871047 RepID=UPI0011CA126F|nr:glycosyltransferase [Chryseobacterium sp.]TXF79018.1 glycosyltransferase [Chryseobacterium sp.]
MKEKPNRWRRGPGDNARRCLTTKKLPQWLFLSTFPPRECGIATYSQDLIKAMNDKFAQSFEIKVAALENGCHHRYSTEVIEVLQTRNPSSYLKLAQKIKSSDRIELVVLQHEFGLFRHNEKDLLKLLNNLRKPLVVVFHTVLPKPSAEIQQYIQDIAEISDSLVVMTDAAADILQLDYLIEIEKISIIPHGTHLVKHTDKDILKEKYGFQGRKILSTFGLLSSGKRIETTLRALPEITQQHPDVLFLVIGKTHPSVVQHEGEKYREGLEQLVCDLKLNKNVHFINEYVTLDTLLEYLQLTDIYLFTSSDPNQAVSGTFSYAVSCGCPIISTPIPHACEVLKKECGIIIDFNDSSELARQAIKLLDDEGFRNRISLNGLHRMAPTAWENSAIAHVQLFKKVLNGRPEIHYKIPEINLDHLHRLTVDFGIIQFAVINRPDINSGYTLDDNARALIAICHHYRLFRREIDVALIRLYFRFISYCYQENGGFLNYVDVQKHFTAQNEEDNLDDAAGRAIWALGYLLSLRHILPAQLIAETLKLFDKALEHSQSIHSTRAMAFIIKGLYYANVNTASLQQIQRLELFADRLVQMYRHEADENWQWYESYLTYANSLLPEALLFAWRMTHKEIYREIAADSFHFLIAKIFTEDRIKVISNRGWLHNGQEINDSDQGGEQAIDVAYTVMALSEFYTTFKVKEYKDKMFTAFTWFLGNNHLNRIVYNPCTGGCFDGVEEDYINLNQGAESTVSYLMARLTVEEYLVKTKLPDPLPKTENTLPLIS